MSALPSVLSRTPWLKSNSSKKESMKNQKGFTIVELIICLGGLVVVGVVGFFAYAGIHYVLKFW